MEGGTNHPIGRVGWTEMVMRLDEAQKLRLLCTEENKEKRWKQLKGKEFIRELFQA